MDQQVQGHVGSVNAKPMISHNNHPGSVGHGLSLPLSIVKDQERQAKGHGLRWEQTDVVGF